MWPPLHLGFKIPETQKAGPVPSMRDQPRSITSSGPSLAAHATARPVARWATSRGFPPAHRFLLPGSWQHVFWPMAVYKHLLSILIGQLTVANVVAAGGMDAVCLPDTLPLFVERDASPPSPSARLSPHTECATATVRLRNGTAQDALRPGSGSATEYAGWGLPEDAATPGCHARRAAARGNEGAARSRQRNPRRNVKRPARDCVAAGRNVLDLR